MKSIKCQRCTPESEGCITCGGYKEVLAQSTCICGTLYWTRPGVHTLYEGKEWYSFDGLKFTVKNSKSICEKCMTAAQADEEGNGQNV